MQRDQIAIPIAIVIAAALIAVAIYLSGSRDAGPVGVNPLAPTEQEAPVILPVQDSDHIRGNPNAPIVLVEYSDFDCPFCNDFHQTMTRIMKEYGPGGNIAWVFRHFPITSRHPNAVKIAEASECAAELGGDGAFWKFSDLIFGAKAYDEFTDMSKIAEYARDAGITDAAAFDTCLSSGKYTAQVLASIDEAQKAGATGTPYPIIMAGDQMSGLKGALPYEDMKQIFDSLISQLEGKKATTTAQ